MAGRTTLQADASLNRYRNIAAPAVAQTWATLFTSNPAVDAPDAATHLAVEWGPARVRIFPDSGSGSPYWSEPQSFSDQVRQIVNQGGVGWTAVTLTTSPALVVGFGIYDQQTDGNLLTWGVVTPGINVVTGGSYVLGTGQLKIRGD